VPPDLRPLGAAHDRGHAPAKAVLPRAGEAPHNRLTTCQKVFRTHGHRERRQHDAPPHVLRDARQLLAQVTIQAGRRRVRVGVLARGPRARRGRHLDHGVRRSDDELGPRARRGGHRGLGVVGVPRERIVLLQSSENFWQGRPDGSLRSLLRALLRPRPGVRGRGRPGPGGENERFVEYLEPRVHAVQPGPGNTLVPLPAKNIDTGLGLNPHGDGPAGRPVDLRDGPVQAADRTGGGAVGSPLRRGLRDRSRASDPRPTTRAGCASSWPTASCRPTRTAGTSSAA